MRILIDTNVILDIALERPPFVEHAVRLLKIAQQTDLVVYVTATTITDLYYITRKAHSHITAHDFIVDLLQLVEVADVDGAIIREALDSEIEDFEDAIQESAAKRQSIQAIVTRNEADFEDSVLQVYDPEAFLEAYSR